MDSREHMKLWAEREKAKLQPTLRMMLTGRMSTRDGQIDTTQESIQRFRDLIADLDEWIAGRVPPLR
jgi:hypothetical protein